MFKVESEIEIPAVGDWVQVDYFNENIFAVINEILPRETILKRKVSGKKTEFQLLAANIAILLL